MFPCVGLKQKVFAWGGTVISAVLLHIYSCTFSVGHLVLLNDVKLWLMRADARLSSCQWKAALWWWAEENRHSIHDSAHSKHVCKHEGIERLGQAVNFSSPFVLMSLIYCSFVGAISSFTKFPSRGSNTCKHTYILGLLTRFVLH